MKALCLLISLGILGACTAPHEEPHGPTGSRLFTVEQVLGKHQTSPYMLDESPLPPAENPPGWIFQAASERHVIHRLPRQPQTADMFQYRIALDRVTGTYWIIQSGGYAGRRAVFGPGTVSAPATH